ncbi:MAG TPA: tetratricopeptide repeat protein [Woeseiaceae bacterium]|nr:tetratricopeptide repeat protein [Woeseiaceae bacterium]
MRRHSLLSWLLLTGAMLWLAGCAAVPPVAPPAHIHPIVFADPGQFGTRPEIPTPDEIHALTEAQREAFRDYLDAHENSKVPLHRRVYEYLEQVTQDFNYQGDTFMAADALALGRGNCLSLAILTTALAQLAGVDIGYQLVDDIPVYQLTGQLVKRGVHVRSILYASRAKQDGVVLFSRPGIVVDYFPIGGSRFVGNLGEHGYVAMYYRNIAVEALEREDYRSAYWYAVESLQFAPENSAGLNLLAVVYGRAGDERKAEAIYRYGLQVADNQLGLLKNYRSLLLRTGRDAEAHAIEERLARMDDPSPLHWLELARSAYQDREYRLAIGYYGRALELAPYLHEGYLGLARAYYEAGELERAERALKDALENAFRSSTRSLYQAKLQALNEEMHKHGSGG